MTTLARPGFDLGNWDVVIRYELDDAGNVTQYAEDGLYSEYIDCMGDWTETYNSTGPSSTSKWLIEYAIDYPNGKLASLEIRDGEKFKLIYTCDLFTIDLLEESDRGIMEATKCAGSGVDTTYTDEWSRAQLDGDGSYISEGTQSPAIDAACYTLRFVRHESSGEVFTGVLNGGDVLRFRKSG